MLINFFALALLLLFTLTEIKPTSEKKSSNFFDYELNQTSRIIQLFLELQTQISIFFANEAAVKALFCEQIKLLIELYKGSNLAKDQLKAKNSLKTYFENLENQFNKILINLNLAKNVGGQLIIASEISTQTQTKLQQILQTIAQLKAKLFFTETYSDDNGNTGYASGVIEFKDESSAQAFNVAQSANLPESELRKLGVEKMHVTAKYHKATLPQNEIVSKPTAQNYKLESHVSAVLEEIQSSNAVDSSALQTPSNWSFTCTPFMSNETHYIRILSPEAEAFNQINDYFEKPNIVPGFNIGNISSQPIFRDTLKYYGQQLNLGSKFKFFDLESPAGGNFNSPTSPGPQTPPSGNSSGSPAGSSGGNNPPEKPSDQENKNNSAKATKEPRKPIFTESDRLTVKNNSFSGLLTSGTFKHFGSLANRNLCDMSSEFYAQGVHDMAKSIETYIEKRDLFFEEIQDDHATMRRMLEQFNNKAPKKFYDDLAKTLDATKIPLPDNPQKSIEQINKETALRMDRANRDFIQNLMLPKNILSQLTAKDHEELINHAHRTIGKANWETSAIHNMHFFSNIGLNVGFLHGNKYADEELMEQNEQLKQQLETSENSRAIAQNKIKSYEQNIDQQSNQKKIAITALAHAKKTTAALERSEAEKQKITEEKNKITEEKKISDEKLKKAEEEVKKYKAFFLQQVAVAQQNRSEKIPTHEKPLAQQNNSVESSEREKILEQENALLRQEKNQLHKEKLDNLSNQQFVVIVPQGQTTAAMEKLKVDLLNEKISRNRELQELDEAKLQNNLLEDSIEKIKTESEINSKQNTILRKIVIDLNNEISFYKICFKEELSTKEEISEDEK